MFCQHIDFTSIFVTYGELEMSSAFCASYVFQNSSDHTHTHMLSDMCCKNWVNHTCVTCVIRIGLVTCVGNIGEFT